MGMSVSERSKIYVVCPANFATGGPEVLHQLVNVLNTCGREAYMYYLPSDHPDPIHSEYTSYNNPFVREIDDDRANILIMPEIYPHKLNDSFSKIQKVIWWLSVDNYYDEPFNVSFQKKFYEKCNKKVKKIFKNITVFNLEKCRAAFGKRFPLPESYRNITHFAQSEYARQHLMKKNITSVFHLSDYINEEFFKNASTIQKEDLVLYNPKKGYEFTQKLISQSPTFKWVPIENMTRSQVQELLKKAKVYIDFGTHPGKDRIPREAALAGCCVITGRQGSAAYYEDVPIPDDFKFNEDTHTIPAICKKINECFTDYEKMSQQFEPYRTIISNDKSTFELEVRTQFGC